MRAIPPAHQHTLLPDAADAEYVYASPANESDWRDYWKVVVKRWRLLVLAFSVVAGIGAYFSLTATPLYTAVSILKIEPQNPSVTGVAGVQNLEASPDYYQTQFALMKSRRLATKVIAELKLDSNDDFTKLSIVSSNVKDRLSSLILGNLESVIWRIASLVSASPKKNTQKQASTRQTIELQSDAVRQQLDPKYSRWVGRYLSLLKLNPVKGTLLVEVKFATPDAAFSQQLANAHAKAFIAMNMESRQELTEEARHYLDSKNAELKKAVEQSEEKLNRFRQTHGVVSMAPGENITVDRMVEVNRRLTEARAQRIEAESLHKFVENKPFQSLSQVMTQGLVPSLRASLQNLEAERVKLSSTFKPDHPRMLELNQQISEVRRSLNAEIANIVKGIEQAYAAARAKEQALQAEAQKQQQNALDMKQLGVEYAVLEEEVKVNRTLYENVLNRLNSTSISNDLAISNMQVLQLAEMPGFPSDPNTPFDIGLSALLGLFLGLGLIFALEYVDSTVSTPQHVWRAVALSTFGVVPDLNSVKPLLNYNRTAGLGLLSRLKSLRLSSRSDRPGDLLVQHHPLSIVAESYRTIRTALLFSRAEEPPQVILLTSPSPGEGKTVTTLNLAVSLVQDGNKVLVIDADLRKGGCHRRLGLTNHRGLANILTGNMVLQEGIQETSVSGLSLLSRGPSPPNPSDLLGSNQMKQVLATLRESFNFILIDSPPAIAVSDAAVLSINSDGVILVFHAQKTTRASALRALECLEAVRAPILGTILNGVNLRNPDYAYYRYYYGSDYGVIPQNNGYSSSGDVTDAVIQSELPELKTPSIELGPGIVSREFFDTMIAKLCEAVGPMSSLIVAEQVASLGETLNTFPKSRLKELFDQLCEEILDNDLRRRFETAMAEELRSL
jgi:succinoglycan biosynthesis transport protein ExoP